MIIGLCGLARSGKDTFFSFIENLDFNKKPNVRLPFAQKLKEELDLFLRDKFAISAFTEKEEEKAVIRPILVAYGMQKRSITNGMYWIDEVNKQINRFLDDYNYFITDVRFPNEVSNIKERGGICIYIERKGNTPANKEEEYNDPIIKDMCDFKFEWENFEENERPIFKKTAQNFLIENIKYEI